jgi:hypothetical protein
VKSDGRRVLILQWEHPAWRFRPIFTAMGAAQQVAMGAALDGKEEISQQQHAPQLL